MNGRSIQNSLFVCLVTVLSIVGCAVPESSIPDAFDDASALAIDTFARPHGLAVTEDYVFVTNANYVAKASGLEFDQGFIRVVERASLEPVARYDLPLKNPTRAVVWGDDLWVLCAGAYRQEQDGIFYSKSPGGLVLVPGAGRTPSAPGPIESFPLGADGSPGAWIVQEDLGRVVLGSSLVAELYVFDLNARAWINDRDNPIERPAPAANETLALAEHPEGSIAVFSFSRNQAALLDQHTLEPKDGLGEQPITQGSDLEGPVFATFLPGSDPPQAVIVLTLSNYLARWNPASSDPIDARWKTIGLATNEVHATDDAIYVLESGENTITRLSHEGGDEKRLIFEVGADPYNMAFAPGGEVAYVTTLLENRIWEIDLNTFSTTRSLGP